MQTYLETQQTLAALLEQARQEGAVRIQRENGQRFVLKPERSPAPASEKRSPLDVEGLNLGISTQEVIEFIHEGRKQF